ncbi:hypothetical protein AVEN_126933-1, partial [Araneus ventricosus]
MGKEATKSSTTPLFRREKLPQEQLNPAPFLDALYRFAAVLAALVCS